MTRTMVRLTIVSLVLLASVGCRSMTGQSLGTNIDNATTTATVKARLTADKLQNLTWVDVDTSGGTVYLTGTAATEAQKTRAGEIARNVNGVERVVNNIEVQPGAAARTAAAGTAEGAASASPPGSGALGRHTMTGEVTSVNRDSGHLGLRTADHGELALHFPPAALAGVKPGDRLTVELAITPGR